MLTYKIATNDSEYEAIHRLNHRTFAEEIPQHPADPQGRLVDKFHAENTYAICLDAGTVVGMVAGRSHRPFSLDGKVTDLDRYLPSDRRAVEIRLLAVDPAHRSGATSARLIALISSHFAEQGCDLAIISGTTRALEMYRRMGFVPFGPLTGAPGAQFQPMYLTVEDARRSSWFANGERAFDSYLPGPVTVAPEVTAAFGQPPGYHRSAEYVDMLSSLHRRLSEFAGSRHTQILMGSGTLANDVVAAQIRQLGTRGLVLGNGEFGDRLIDHAVRMDLNFHTHTIPWGMQFAREDILEKLPRGGWLWATHCETSTGTLLDLPWLAQVCAENDVKLCVDCISSIGTVPLDLSNVYLASGASGKALGSYPGLSMVFYADTPRPAQIPRYLDLGTYAAAEGIAFTQSSNLVDALSTALFVTNWPDRYARLAHASAWMHGRLRRLGFTVVANQAHAAPGICTIALPDAELVGKTMEAEGYLLAYQSGYLRSRNWLQISLMGRWTWPSLRNLIRTLAQIHRPGAS